MCVKRFDFTFLHHCLDLFCGTECRKKQKKTNLPAGHEYTLQYPVFCSLHLTEFPLEIMDVGSQGRTSTFEGGSHACESHVNFEHVHVYLYRLDQQTCNIVIKTRGWEWEVGQTVPRETGWRTLSHPTRTNADSQERETEWAYL